MKRRILFQIAFAITATCCATAAAQDVMWETYIKAGIEARDRAEYAKAEKLYRAALREAEAFGPQDPRLATSLNNLGLLYATQGKYAEAMPLLKRALAILEKVLGPKHPNTMTARENYAGLLKKLNEAVGPQKPEVQAKAGRGD